MVELLIGYTSIDPNILDENAFSPLHLAVHYSEVKVTKMLLEHPRIDLKVHDNQERTPLLVAREKKSSEEDNTNLQEIIALLEQK